MMLKIKTIAELAQDAVPDEYKSCPWLLTGHGTRILRSEDALNAYLAAYAELHKRKLDAVFMHVNFGEIREEGFYIVDWGAGQGLGSLALLENLREEFSEQDRPKDPARAVNGILLIEKSPEARERAELFVSGSLKMHDDSKNCTWSVRGIDWDLGDVRSMLMRLPFGANVVHVFSNILDIVSIRESFDQIKELIEWCHHHIQYDGKTYLVGVGPVGDNKGSCGAQLKEFRDLFRSPWKTVKALRIPVKMRRGVSMNCGFVLRQASFLERQFQNGCQIWKRKNM